MRLLSDLSDDRLVELFRAGREDAFGVLYDRYRLRLVRFARRILSGAAEDVVQEAFLRAHAALRRTDRAIVLGPWLYTVVRNRALDVRQSSGLLRHRQYCQPVSLLPLGDPELSMDQRDRLHRVVDQIGHLPERERRALVLARVRGQDPCRASRPARHVRGGDKGARVSRSRAAETRGEGGRRLGPMRRAEIVALAVRACRGSSQSPSARTRSAQSAWMLAACCSRSSAAR